jgi:phenylacetic acid degradation operon negative regulatory protein
MSTAGNASRPAARAAARHTQAPALDALDLRPLTARSVLLSALLGTHPPRLPVRVLVKVGELFEIPEGTVRVALSRMVADGDVVQDDGAYRLTGRLLARHERQDDSRAPHTHGWEGGWEMAVVTSSGRPAAERAALRRALADLHLAELREGVWVRPDNLDRAWSELVRERCLHAEARFDDGVAAGLVASLWDLPAWAARARQLEAALVDAGDRDGLAAGFMVSAAALRHLLADPLLPAELLPDDWPGPRLRQRYERFDADYKAHLREHTRA